MRVLLSRQQYGVGSRVIVLLLSFFEYFVQLIYSCTHLFSDSTLVNSKASWADTVVTAPPSSRARKVDAWEVRGHMNSELYALHSTDMTREVRPVRRLLVICCWFLVPVGRDVCSRPDEPEHCCWPLFYRYTVRPRRSLDRFHPLTQHAPYVTPTDRRLALRGRCRRRRHHYAVSGRGSSSWESPTPPADEDVAVQRHGHLPNFCCYQLPRCRPTVSCLPFSSLSFGDPLDSRALRFTIADWLLIECLLVVALKML